MDHAKRLTNNARDYMGTTWERFHPSARINIHIDSLRSGFLTLHCDRRISAIAVKTAQGLG